MIERLLTHALAGIVPILDMPRQFFASSRLHHEVPVNGSSRGRPIPYPAIYRRRYIPANSVAFLTARIVIATLPWDWRQSGIIECWGRSLQVAYSRLHIESVPCGRACSDPSTRRLATHLAVRSNPETWRARRTREPIGPRREQY